ncbi:sensor histidine kinase [Paenibacillus cremeus]|uniref:histidine kinase n=1 Tax=Paenibacillus cremeus TaxID=2163881 RepID=A0A559K6E2_9BACL|nr:sensor histidine kinase [Paenibacillus cremeus]TVY07689.1 cell wall metabolism sensor histidine kinase WalK [Paenibacillus cremeus]
MRSNLPPLAGPSAFHLTSSSGKAEIHIVDSGTGISDDEQMHIFERFYKADKSRNRTMGGSGLGLSIVKKIIDMHHGTITVTSQLGQGTTFIVA